MHALAVAYGWDKKTILEQLYPEEIEPLLKRIRKHEAVQDLKQLAIIHNPHTKDPKKLASQFEKSLYGEERSYIHKETMDEVNERKLIEIRELMKQNALKKRLRNS